MRCTENSIFRNKSTNSDGFTLVELIVVVVILAILAAILVPALLGYIDRTKESQDMIKAKNMLQATQTVLTDYYAKGKRINLMFMFVANKSKDSNPWSEIQKAVEKNGHNYSQAGKTK